MERTGRLVLLTVVAWGLVLPACSSDGPGAVTSTTTALLSTTATAAATTPSTTGSAAPSTTASSPSADGKPSADARALIIELKGRSGPRGVILDVSGDVLFDSGSSTLKAAAQPTIDKVAKLTRLIRRDRIRIAGHTDNVGPPAENRKLSLDRAQAVRDALVAANAELGGRTDIDGKGETEPVATNGTAEGRAQNRRVEIELQGVRF